MSLSLKSFISAVGVAATLASCGHASTTSGLDYNTPDGPPPTMITVERDGYGVGSRVPLGDEITATVYTSTRYDRTLAGADIGAKGHVTFPKLEGKDYVVLSLRLVNDSPKVCAWSGLYQTISVVNKPVKDGLPEGEMTTYGVPDNIEQAIRPHMELIPAGGTYSTHVVFSVPENTVAVAVNLKQDFDAVPTSVNIART